MTSRRGACMPPTFFSKAPEMTAGRKLSTGIPPMAHAGTGQETAALQALSQYVVYGRVYTQYVRARLARFGSTPCSPSVFTSGAFVSNLPEVAALPLPVGPPCGLHRCARRCRAVAAPSPSMRGTAPAGTAAPGGSGRMCGPHAWCLGPCRISGKVLTGTAGLANAGFPNTPLSAGETGPFGMRSRVGDTLAHMSQGNGRFG